MSPERTPSEELERSRTEASEVSWALRDLNRATADLDRALADHMRLRPMDYDAIGHVMDAERDPLGTLELAARLRISPGSATELVDRLEKAGHVRRERSRTDRRRVQVSVTPHAIAQVLGDLGPLFRLLDDLAAGYPPAEQEVIAGFLRGAAERTRTFMATLDADTLPT
ncbi:MarR family transcriptional regulator [Microbacterium invictum]|uniref:MarR family transcriptional regulator n=1 Tax=Microbacterium invictum TaxID=515415 RepID=A0ABZ0V8H4_9MICO|nr:MarR family transcriptional regulator [Microbacterium invictum]WQB69923.1 MarR family transcriptional regulator [Microbacterium invictum]